VPPPWPALLMPTPYPYIHSMLAPLTMPPVPCAVRLGQASLGSKCAHPPFLSGAPPSPCRPAPSAHLCILRSLDGQSLGRACTPCSADAHRAHPPTHAGAALIGQPVTGRGRRANVRRAAQRATRGGAPE